jgi:hypothetical protein
MTSGIHTWGIVVEEYCKHVWLGVTSTVDQSCTQGWLGSQEGAWVYGTDGRACHNGVKIGEHTPFGEGSTVTFTLDLTKRGTLSAAVDEHPASLLCSDMLSGLDDQQPKPRFVPAASLKHPARVRFLGFVTTSESSLQSSLQRSLNLS